MLFLTRNLIKNIYCLTQLFMYVKTLRFLITITLTGGLKYILIILKAANAIYLHRTRMGKG